MFGIHRDYIIQNQHHFHAHIEVNPIGRLECEILESRENHNVEFDQISFENIEGATKLTGYDEKGQSGAWCLLLTDKDALELSNLISLAKEEYEILMCDLM